MATTAVECSAIAHDGDDDHADEHLGEAERLPGGPTLPTSIPTSRPPAPSRRQARRPRGLRPLRAVRAAGLPLNSSRCARANGLQTCDEQNAGDGQRQPLLDERMPAPAIGVAPVKDLEISGRTRRANEDVSHRLVEAQIGCFTPPAIMTPDERQVADDGSGNRRLHHRDQPRVQRISAMINQGGCQNGVSSRHAFAQCREPVACPSARRGRSPAWQTNSQTRHATRARTG